MGCVDPLLFKLMQRHKLIISLCRLKQGTFMPTQNYLVNSSFRLDVWFTNSLSVTSYQAYLH